MEWTMANRYEKTGTINTSGKVFSHWTELFHGPVCEPIPRR